MEITYRGIGVSPGIAIGPALVFDVDRCEVPHREVTDTKAELERLDAAIEATRQDLKLLYRQTARELGKTHADIFNAHLMLLEDVVIRQELTEQLDAQKVNVEHLLDQLAQKYARILEGIDDPRFSERTADLLDVVDRILHHLLDSERPNLKEIPFPSIIVAHGLSPSDTATMKVENTLGLVMDAGSATSHTAILARALEVPAVVGLGQAGSRVENGATMIMDGSEGLVIFDPRPATLERYKKAQADLRQRQERLSKSTSELPSRTLDGFAVTTEANVELPIEIAHAVKSRAEGIGLYRTEYLFLNRDSLPSEEEQYEAYAAAAKALNPYPVTLRTMDIGGDKFVSHMQISKEENPQLGWRAVRFCLQRPDIFKTQLRAMLRASVHGKVQIMFPMISGVDELRQVKAVLSEVREELRRQRIPFDRTLPVGSMIEVPSAVTLTDILARECDFFSIGTNDLIQYSLAVDRVNEKIAHLYDPSHPAVLRMIRWTANAAKTAGIPCHLCGEMAGDPLYTEVLIGLGVSVLSMSAISLPVVRAEITHTRLSDAETLARRALKMATAAEVREVLQERFERKGAIDTPTAATAARPKGAGTS